LDTRTLHEMGAAGDYPGRCDDSQFVINIANCATCKGEGMIFKNKKIYKKAQVVRISGRPELVYKNVIIPAGFDICPTCRKRAEAQYRTRL